ncbi:hypothetical protein ABZS54_34095, partial [Embleya sp. NPDC005575]
MSTARHVGHPVGAALAGGVAGADALRTLVEVALAALAGAPDRHGTDPGHPGLPHGLDGRCGLR